MRRKLTGLDGLGYRVMIAVLAPIMILVLVCLLTIIAVLSPISAFLPMWVDEEGKIQFEDKDDS